MPKKAAAAGGGSGSKRKAPAAAAAVPAEKKTKATPSEIPVDDAARNKIGGLLSVHKDYAWLGNQTEIDKNANKFYRGQVVQSGSVFYSWTHWGRVGVTSQTAVDGPMDAASAVKSFEKKFKSKTGHTWQGNQAPYPAPTKKDTYTVIFEKFGGGDQSSKLAEAGLGGAEIKNFAPAETTGVLADFVHMVTDNDMFASQLKGMGIDTAKMPLGDIDQRTVDAGFEALDKVENCLKAGGGSQLAGLCSTFYTYIPHNFGMKKAPLLTLADIRAKREMLNIISDVGSAVTAQKTKKKCKGKGKGKAAAASLEPAPIDQMYDSLGCTLQPVDKKSKEFKMIEVYTANTQGYRKCTVAEVFKVTREGDAFGANKKLGNRKLLWHGTNIAVVAAILKSGLRIMPHSGGRVGSGIYLASENGKSAGYVGTHGHDGVMFLCEAALGKQRIVTRDGQVQWNEKDPVSAHGADSVYAVGQKEPDSTHDITVKFDGADVVVPQGQVGPNPLLAKHGGSSSFDQSEYLVYKESQCTIRYVIKMRFT